MAALSPLEENREFECCYFEDSELKVVLVVAATKQDALDIYVEQGKRLNDLYSIRPDY